MAWGSKKGSQADWPASSGPGVAPQSHVPAAVAGVLGKETPAPKPEPKAESQKRPVTERRMVERKSPELVQFDGKGVFVSGVLKEIVQVEVKERNKQGELTGKVSKCIQYTFFNDEERKPYKILGTYDLNNKISRADVGLYCEITYIGENPDVGRNGNQMKEFKVQFEETGNFSDGSPITDEDIPF
jgi:hypothetical protein